MIVHEKLSAGFQPHFVRRAMIRVLAVGLLVAGAACAHRAEFKNKYNESHTIHCRVLGLVDEEVMSFTEKAIVTSFVPIEILEPENLKRSSTRLILQRNEMRLYPRMAIGEAWREVGSIQTVEVVVNTKSGEIFLYPPLNIPKSALNF